MQADGDKIAYFSLFLFLAKLVYSMSKNIFTKLGVMRPYIVDESH